MRVALNLFGSSSTRNVTLAVLDPRSASNGTAQYDYYTHSIKFYEQIIDNILDVDGDGVGDIDIPCANILISVTSDTAYQLSTGRAFEPPPPPFSAWTSQFSSTSTKHGISR